MKESVREGLSEHTLGEGPSKGAFLWAVSEPGSDAPRHCSGWTGAGGIGQEGSCGVKNLAALQASNRPRPSPTCYSCPDRGLVMADTSLRDKEPDRALVYVFPGSALPALTSRPCLLCGASWATATGSLCSSTSSSSLQRPPREPAPVCPSFKGQPLLSLLLPLYAEPS